MFLVPCPICGKEFKSGGLHHHVQRIHEGKHINYRGVYTPISEEERERRRIRGKNQPHPKHSEETKKKLSEIARSQTHRRLVKSCRIYHKKNGTQVLLDSSWEEVLAKRLDELNIDWIRPKPLRWKDKMGNHHNYFPDFYLTEYDIYLDPKNPYAKIVQAEKLEIITKLFPNLQILDTIDKIKNWSYSSTE